MRIELNRFTSGILLACLLGVLAMTMHGQSYSEMMRQKQLGGGVLQEPLTLPKGHPRTSVQATPPAIPPARSSRLWDYQPEPHLEDMPPHLTRFLGMLLYYANGRVFVVYSNPEALHHQKGLRAGDRILSVNGKNVRFYKNQFFAHLNEVRPDRDILIQCEAGNPRLQQILILPNITLPDRNLDKLLIAMKRNSGSLWQTSAHQGSSLQTKPVRRQRFLSADSKSKLSSPLQARTVNLFGMQVGMGQGRLLVMEVAKQSAAASARIRSGDEILSVNSQPASRLQLEDLRNFATMEPVLIEWRSQVGGQPQLGYFNRSPRK